MVKNGTTSTAIILFDEAVTMGLNPEWVIPDRIFAVRTSEGEQLVNAAASPRNPFLGVSMSINKYATRMVLQRYGFPNIPFCRPRDRVEAEEFLMEHGKIILKPLRGSGSRGIHIVTEPLQLTEFEVERCILEKYIEGKEMRYLVLDGVVVAVHESEYGRSVAADRELQRISYPPEDWNADLVDIAIRIAKVFGLHLCAVDYMVDSAGNALILELNSGPGFKLIHNPTSGPSVNLARLYLDSILPKSPRV